MKSDEMTKTLTSLTKTEILKRKLGNYTSTQNEK